MDKDGRHVPIYIPQDLHRQFKLRCVERGMPLQEAAEIIVRSWMSLPVKKAFPKKQL